MKCRQELWVFSKWRFEMWLTKVGSVESGRKTQGSVEKRGQRKDEMSHPNLENIKSGSRCIQHPREQLGLCHHLDSQLSPVLLSDWGPFAWSQVHNGWITLKQVMKRDHNVLWAHAENIQAIWFIVCVCVCVCTLVIVLQPNRAGWRKVPLLRASSC